MNRIIFILTLSAFLFSQQAEVTNIQAAQRTDGSQIVDITYDITPDAVFTYFNVSGEVSMDGGNTYEDLQFATGDIGIGITAGTGRAIAWGFGQQFNETYSNQVKIKINATSTAIIAGDSLEVPFEMITIPAGGYTYGENDAVQTISYDYEMMKYDVTDFDYVVYLMNGWIGEDLEICSDLTNLDGSPWHELGGYSNDPNDTMYNCQWYTNNTDCYECDSDDCYNDVWNNDAGYSAGDACCYCGGGSFSTYNVNIQPDGIYGNYPGDAQYPAGEYLLLDFSQSKISYNGEIFEVEEGYVDHPVTGVTWFGAWHFAIHYGLQLPSQFEWEKAARGLTGYDYPWGDQIDPMNANYNSGISDGMILEDVGYMPDEQLWVSFGYGNDISSTTSAGYFDGTNSWQTPNYAASIEYIAFLDPNMESPYFENEGEGSGYNIPFTINNDCTDIAFGLWDTYGINSVYYSLTSLSQSEILLSGNVASPGCGVGWWGAQESQDNFDGQGPFEDDDAIQECLSSGQYNCGNDSEEEYDAPCNSWDVYNVQCLPTGEYNLEVVNIYNWDWIMDIIVYVDIDPQNPEMETEITIDSPSPYGLYDMAGNVSQWMNKFPISSTSGIKGGNWGDSAENLVSWNIIQQDPLTASNQMGFRCIKPISVNLNRNPRKMLEEHKRRHRQPPVHPSERKIDGN